MAAGRLRNIVQFERRSQLADDGYGNTIPADWESIPNGRYRAGFRPQFGREQIEAGRLESTLRGVLTVRKSQLTATFSPADRVVFVGGAYAGKVCQIRSITPTGDNRWIEMALEEGIAE